MAMAWTVADLWLSPSALADARTKEGGYAAVFVAIVVASGFLFAMAAALPITMGARLAKGDRSRFVVAADTFPQTTAVLQARADAIAEVAGLRATLVLYESGPRLGDTFAALAAEFGLVVPGGGIGPGPDRDAVVSGIRDEGIAAR